MLFKVSGKKKKRTNTHISLNINSYRQHSKFFINVFQKFPTNSFLQYILFNWPTLQNLLLLCSYFFFLFCCLFQTLQHGTELLYQHGHSWNCSANQIMCIVDYLLFLRKYMKSVYHYNASCTPTDTALAQQRQDSGPIVKKLRSKTMA